MVFKKRPIKIFHISGQKVIVMILSNTSTIFTVLFIALLIVPVPLVMLWKWFGMALYLCLFGTGMYFAVRIEKYKKKYDIQTYKEIVDRIFEFVFFIKRFTNSQN